MKLGIWTKRQGKHLAGGMAHVQKRNLGCTVILLAAETINVQKSAPPLDEGVALYARVSSADPLNGPERQWALFSAYAATQGIHIVEANREAGSGLNGHRHKMLHLPN